MKKIITLAALLIINFSNSFAQGLDTTQWFPYKAGNMWEYYVVEEGVVFDTMQIINDKDSLLPDGTIYLSQRERFINPTTNGLIQTYIIDTSAQTVFGDHIGSIGEVKMYDFKSKANEQWVMFIYQDTITVYAYEMARVRSISQDTVFGFPTTRMSMRYYYAFDSTDTSGLSRYGAALTKGIGLTFRGFGDIFYALYLKGCVIDGILYGDTTNLVVSVKPGEGDDLPGDFVLLQNYPNPFNPSTTISFELLKYSTVSLIIYDILGNEILKLIDNRELNAGEHKVIWDGLKENERKAASGIYFYWLITNNQVLSRSMILLK
jgi:hypothetical protein